jgi:thiol-disulfide isomerase/thioredoxin
MLKRGKKLFLFNILLTIMLAFPIWAYSQNVVIKGYAPGAEGKLISLSAYADQISFKEQKLVSAIIDSAANFYLCLSAEDTIYGMLNIGYYRSGIFIEPGRTYDIKVDSVDYNAYNEKTNPYLEPQQLNFTMLNFNKNDLNWIIPKFDEIYYDYLNKNAIAIYRLRDYSKIDTFRVIANKLFSYSKSGYFRNYMEYSIGLMEIPFLSSTNRSQLAEKYLKNRPVLYENIKYMEFFDQFFENYLLTAGVIEKQDLVQTINLMPDYYAITDTLGKDSILRNEVLREMVLLKALFELSYNKEFNKNNIALILLQLSKHSKFETHRKTAENILQLFNKLQPETFAPVFSLMDQNKKTISLKDLNGKYVYLSFWTSWCTTCQSEFEVMSKLNDTYGSKVAFISISADKEFLSMVSFLKNQKYKWQFLHFGGDYDLLESYSVKSYPLFVLIDPQGKIILYPAPRPSEHIADYLEYFCNKDSKNVKKPLFPKPQNY